MFKIEKGLKLQPKGTAKYNFTDMQVGDSFLVKCKESEKTVTGKRLRAAAWGYCTKNAGVKFATRSEEKGVRITRIA